MEAVCAPFFCSASEHAFTLHSSPFLRKPLCLSAFRGVKSLQQLFTHSSPLFTILFRRILLFAAVWVTIVDLKSAKRTVARRANSLEADCKSASNRSSLFCLRIANPQERLAVLRCCLRLADLRYDLRLTDLRYDLRLTDLRCCLRLADLRYDLRLSAADCRRTSQGEEW